MMKKVVSIFASIAIALTLAASAMAADEYTEVIPCQYDNARSFSEGLAAVEKDGRWGFIDKEGNEVIPFIYDYALSFNEGLAPVMLDHKMGYIDKTGDVVIPFELFLADNFKEGVASVLLREGGWKWIDKTGQIIIPAEYSLGYDFHEGLALVWSDHKYKYGFIDKTGKEVIPCVYDQLFEIFEGFAAAAKYDQEEKCIKWGFIDKTGKETVPFKYEAASSFSEGLAMVQKDGKQGYINKKGEVVIPLIYKSALNFSNGLAVVTNFDSETFYIDKEGRDAFPDKHCSEAYDFSEGFGRIVVEGSDGKKQMSYIDSDGNLLGDSVFFKDADAFVEGMARVMNGDGKWGFIKLNPGKSGFADVQDYAYYADAVKWAVDTDVTKGTSDAEFSPYAELTRAQAVTFLWRAMGSPSPTTVINPFKDVKLGSYYYDAVLWAMENGITNGLSPTIFGVDGTVTRGQIITFLWRTEGKPDDEGGEWYESAEKWASSKNLLSGTSKAYSTNGICSRADVVFYIWRALVG